MVVVVLTAGGALLALRSYNSTKRNDPKRLEKTLFSVKQQAGVMAAICGAVFGVIGALQSAKMFGGFSNDHSPQNWGKRGNGDRVISLVDQVA